MVDSVYIRQFFNHSTFSFTYLVVDPVTSSGALIDPLRNRLRDYVQLSSEMGVAITMAIDTHSHDDRVSGLAVLRDLWGTQSLACAPYTESRLDRFLKDGDLIRLGHQQLRVMHTPGHTENSCCLYMEQRGRRVVFTGDTLLVRTVGLSNQPGSDPREHYNSLHNVLMKLPPDTVVYPGRDFKGWPQSTIEEERQFNPYLQAPSLDAFLALKQTQKPATVTPITKAESTVNGESDRFVRMLLGRAPVLSEQPSLPDDDPSLSVPSWR